MLPKLPDGGRYTGYVRVSTKDQNPDLQVRALIDAGVPEERVYTDYMTGSTMTRPQLARAMRVSRRGDVLVVWKIDRLGRSALGVLDAIASMEAEGIGLISLTEGFNTTTPHGRMVMQILLALAEMERNLISERTRAGMQAAKERGVRFGRPHFVRDYPKRLAEFTRLWSEGLIPDGEMTGPELVEALNAADPKAPNIKGPSRYHNWKKTGFKGFEPPPDKPLMEVEDD